MKLLLSFLFLILCILHVNPCIHAGGPVKESTIISYIKGIIAPHIPFDIPSIEIDVATGFRLNVSKGEVTALDFSTANVQLLQANTVLFSLDGLAGTVTLYWTVSSGGSTSTGTATLTFTNSQGTITAVIQPDCFKNVNATAVIGSLTFVSSNQPVIEPYWEFLKPILIDILQHEIPNVILEINTQEIKTLVYPIVAGLEPIHIPNVNVTVLGIYGGLSNLLLNNIDFQSATMGRGASDNEVVFELIQMTALITNDWEFSALGIDKKGSGHVSINETTVSVTIGIGQDSKGEFTINLDTSKISIGGLAIKVDGGDSVVLNWFLTEITPILVATIQDAFQVVICLLFDGIPSY